MGTRSSAELAMMGAVLMLIAGAALGRLGG